MSSSRRSSSTPITSAIASRVTSSGVGPEAAAHDDRVGAFEQLAQALHHALEVVAHLAVLAGVDARRRELLADPRAVGVDDLAEQQLGADGEHVTPHRAHPSRRPSGRTRARALAADDDVETGHDRQPDRQPQEDVVERRPLVGGRQQHDADREELEERLPLAQAAGRQRDAVPGRRTSGTSRRRPRARSTMSTAAHEKSPLMPRAKKPPSTRNLSASGSRNAPERVVPSRRASQPSRPSVVVSTNQSETVSQLEPWSMISRSVGTARTRRAIVTMLAGVAMASSP